MLPYDIYNRLVLAKREVISVQRPSVIDLTKPTHLDRESQDMTRPSSPKYIYTHKTHHNIQRVSQNWIDRIQWTQSKGPTSAYLRHHRQMLPNRLLALLHRHQTPKRRRPRPPHLRPLHPTRRHILKHTLPDRAVDPIAPDEHIRRRVRPILKVDRDR